MPFTAIDRDATGAQRQRADGADGLGGARLGLDVGEQRVELVLVQRLLLEQRRGEPVEVRAVLRRAGGSPPRTPRR